MLFDFNFALELKARIVRDLFLEQFCKEPVAKNVTLLLL